MEIKFNAKDTVRIPDGCKAIIKDGVVIFEPKCEFKDGDILTSEDKFGNFPLIFKGNDEKGRHKFYACIGHLGDLIINNDDKGNCGDAKLTIATEEEKQKLFAKMKEQGLRWNTEKKRVEKIRWRAEYRCRYHFVTSCLKVGSDIDFRRTEDEERWEVGNHFQTGEEAEEAAKILRGTLGKFHTEKME